MAGRAGGAHLAPLGRDDRRDGPALIFLEDASVMNARVQQSKLASLGRLSASIAHEIRNPLFIIRTSAEKLKETHHEQAGEIDEFIIEEVDRLNTAYGQLQHAVDPDLKDDWVS
mgnify:CR=1 FL=1